MADLEDVVWPPVRARSGRVLLRESEGRDRDAYLDLLSAPEVFTYLGGPQPREQLDRQAPAVPGRRPGVFAVEADGAFVGIVTLNRRDRERPGHVRAEGRELEVGYLLLPSAWGRGYATEAVAGVLGWTDEVLPGELVVLCTQVANVASVRVAQRCGFREVERFLEFGAEQWFGVREPAQRRPST